MKNAIPWILLFLISLGVGFLHGVRPQNFSRSAYFENETLEILATDEILFSEDLREELLQKYNLKISLKITRDWDQYIGHTVSQDSVDLLLIPVHWAQSLNAQNLLYSLSETGLFRKISPDFLKLNTNPSFLPLFWFKTSFAPEDLSFEKFLESPQKDTLYLLADEDLVLHHCLIWKKNNTLDRVKKKNLRFLPITSASSATSDNGLIEVATNQNTQTTMNSSLLVFGAAIPVHSTKKGHSLNVLKTLMSDDYIENKLLNSPFSSTFEITKNERIPLYKRAQNIRNLSFKNTFILEKKIENAAQRIQSECGFNFSNQ